MSATELTLSEKASLSKLARRLVQHGARANEDGAKPRETTEGADCFSDEGRLLRLIELEKRMDAIGRDWSKTLNVVLSTVERLEARIARLDGEVDGLKSREERLELSVERYTSELTASATTFAEAAATRIETALEKVDALLSTGSFSSSVEFSKEAAAD